MEASSPGLERTIVVTGASSGIGRATTTELARRGAHVVAVVRDPDRAPATAGRSAAIVTGSTRGTTRGRDAGAPGRITVVQADLSRPNQVVGAAQRIVDQFGRVDVLINNAATVPRRRSETPEGFELQLAVNHLAPVLLTHHLLPTMAGGRVIVVSSALHADPSAEIDFANLGARSDYDVGKMPGWTQYCRTKRMNLLFALRLARSIDVEHATVNALHPGAVSTGLSRELPLVTRLVAKLFFSSPKKGAETSVYLADAQEVARVTGGYYVDRRPVRAAAAVYDTDRQDRLHEVTMDLLEPWLR